MRLVAPMTLDGSTALSVETRTKRGDAGVDRRIEDGHRAADVDLDALRRVLLHHRHVLVGRGVEDDVGLRLAR